MRKTLALTLNVSGDVLANTIGFDMIHRYDNDILAANWNHNTAIVMVMAIPAAVRAIAPLISEKQNDPSVISIDSSGKFITPILGAHNYANQLARIIAAKQSVTPIITTTSDLNRSIAIDGFDDFVAIGDVARAMALMNMGAKPKIDNSDNFKLPLTLQAGDDNIDILVSRDTRQIACFFAATSDNAKVVLIPKDLILGVGCSSDATVELSMKLLEATLADNNIDDRSIDKVATIESRKSHPAITGLGYEVLSHPKDALGAIQTPNPSAIVAESIGVQSVAEAAAMLSSGNTSELLVEKQKNSHVTVAIAKKQTRGHLVIVGIGPGDLSLTAPKAINTIASADAVIGFNQYVLAVSSLLEPNQLVESTPIGEEKTRALRAIELAQCGYFVVLLGSGDPGVYALASLVYELLSTSPYDNPSVDVIPGITAGLAASSLLGAPLGHDHCYISLSDLLTPWHTIENKILAAATADFVSIFYNPRSQSRDWQLDRAIEILKTKREVSCPVGIVKNAYRKHQSVLVTTLGQLDTSAVDMTSVVIVGSSKSYAYKGKIITPRGYEI